MFYSLIKVAKLSSVVDSFSISPVRDKTEVKHKGSKWPCVSPSSLVPYSPMSPIHLLRSRVQKATRRGHSPARWHQMNVLWEVELLAGWASLGVGLASYWGAYASCLASRGSCLELCEFEETCQKAFPTHLGHGGETQLEKGLMPAAGPLRQAFFPTS